MTEQTDIRPEEIKRHPLRRIIADFFYIGLGVVLPLVTLGVEITTGMCADSLFDPIPTPFHIALVAIVPLGNFLCWRRVRRGSGQNRRHFTLLSGVVLGISGFYAIVFAPLTPIGLLTFWIGLGLLPLAPLFAFGTALMLLFKLRKLQWQQVPAKYTNAWWGVLLALVCTALIQAPDSLTRMGMQMAGSDSPQTRLQGIGLLRSIGLESVLLNACYDRSGRGAEMFSYLFTLGTGHISPADARKIYYRVTGRAFNGESRPARRGGRLNWDFEVGGSKVGGRQEQLFLHSSIIDGSIAADAGVAYLEWTMELKNESLRIAEGRLQIGLPPGAVVSRVSLWVNGEEREAAFAGRGKARQAYESVVRRSRDPLLVTTQGPDTLLMQMFPVPAQGKMKARIGITVPLHLLDLKQGLLRLPFIKERNFTVRDDLQHTVWLESRQKMLVDKQLFPVPVLTKQVYRLEANIKDDVLGTPASHIRLHRDAKILRVLSRDKKQAGKVIAQQVHSTMSEFSHLVIVIDGSGFMRDHVDAVSSFISRLSVSMRPTVLIAADQVEQLDFLNKQQLQPQAVRQTLSKVAFEGGADNLPALLKAQQLSMQHENSAIVWIHGPQPVELASVETLRHHWARQKDRPRLFSYNIRRGANRILDQLDGISMVTPLLRIGTPEEDLGKLADYLNRQQPRYAYRRHAIGMAKLKRQDIKELTRNRHIVRLWARDRIQQLVDIKKRQQAIKLAARYQLVTSVSGAVVLESEAQYKRAGLNPVKPGTVPTIPEPEEWAMLMVVLFLLSWFKFRRPQGNGKPA